VLQARAEARAAMEAAAEQRLAAALARERARADKQARSLLCMHGPWLHRPSLALQIVHAADCKRYMLCTCMWQHGACGGSAQLLFCKLV
jgi:hypothetical protein